MKVSVFVATYNIGESLYLLYQSVEKQSYTDWELVIYDDSTDTKTKEVITNITNNDDRVKAIFPKEHSGIIGYTKRQACKACSGDILLEMDHDDTITSDCLQIVVNAFTAYPDAIFAYSDWAEIIKKTQDVDIYPPKFDIKTEYKNYGDNWGIGRGCSYKQYLTNNPNGTSWVTVLGAGDIVSESLTHIVGVPNHLRAWTKKGYWEAGGHDPQLTRCDDYDLILRTFLKGRFIRIPKLLYNQYMSPTSATNTKIDKDGKSTGDYRNIIQKLVPLVFNKYCGQIQDKLKEYQSDRMFIDIQSTQFYWNHANHIKPLNYTYQPNKDLVSIIIVTFNDFNKLIKAIESVLSQTYKNLEIIIIGNKCSSLPKLMKNYTSDDRIKWWNLSTEYGKEGSVPRNYGLKMISTANYITYLNEDMFLKPNHIESLMKVLKENKAEYAFSSMKFGDDVLLCNKPLKSKIDTSTILHKRNLLEKYGYWKKSSEIGYAVDWEIVSRWYAETYAATKEATVISNDNQIKNWITNKN